MDATSVRRGIGGLWSYRGIGKRWLDWTLALLGLAVLSPLFVAVALLIRLDSAGPVFHRTTRLARGGGTYTLLKFRTMVPDAERLLKHLLATNPEMQREYSASYKLLNDPRITRIGKFLRRWSLDELPQLVNVLRGDMSLVGPRQILPSEIRMYGPDGGKLITVRPGITGLWQISGRSKLSYDDRVRLDMQYIENLSFWLDIKILLKTPKAVLRGEGAV